MTAPQASTLPAAGATDTPARAKPKLGSLRALYAARQLPVHELAMLRALEQAGQGTQPRQATIDQQRQGSK